jgi:hypothetical protein
MQRAIMLLIATMLFGCGGSDAWEDWVIYYHFIHEGETCDNEPILEEDCGCMDDWLLDYDRWGTVIGWKDEPLSPCDQIVAIFPNISRDECREHVCLPPVPRANNEYPYSCDTSLYCIERDFRRNAPEEGEG